MELKHKTISSIKWVTAFQLLKQLMQIGVSITLARLLSPHAYGLVTMSSVAIGLVEAFGHLGISQSIIQKPNCTDEHLNSAFWGTTLFGVILFIFMSLLAPVVAMYYNEDILTGLIIISSIRFLLSPICQTHYAKMEKEMIFDKISKISFGNFLLSSTISIVMAFMGYGVWSLVFGSILTAPLEIYMVWKVVRWRPNLTFDWIKFKELFRFGFYVTLEGLVNYSTSNFDYIILGKISGANVLGVYSVAYSLMTKPLTQISPIFTKVLYPAFSIIQNNNYKLQNAYLRATSILASVTFPIMGGIYCIANEFVIFAYGNKWIDVAPLLKLLCLTGALKSIGTLVGSIQRSKGRPDIGLMLNIMILCIYIPTFIIAAKIWGAIGIAWSYFILSLPLFLISQLYTVKLIELRLLTYLKTIAMPSLLTLFMIVIVLLFKKFVFIFTSNNLIVLGSSICIGMISYSILLYCFYKLAFTEICEFIGIKRFRFLGLNIKQNL